MTPSIRKATLHDLEFLVTADLSSDDTVEDLSVMTAEERDEYRLKIESFLFEEEQKSAWVCTVAERLV